MSNFWTVSLFWIAVLLAIAVALAFILPPLFRPGKARPGFDAAAVQAARRAELAADLRAGTLAADQYAEASRDLDDSVLTAAPPSPASPAAMASGRRAGWALAGLVPAAAIAGYLALGSPMLLVAPPAPVAAAGHETSPMVAALEEKLQRHPDDAAGWAMLGRSYLALGRAEEGAQALGRAAELTPEDATLLADYAEAVALTQDRNMAGRPSELVARALAIDDKEEKALTLAGIAASQVEDYAKAVGYWRRLLAVIPQNSELARQVAAAVARAEASAAAKRAGAPAAGPAAAGSAAAGKSISGILSISPQLAAKAGSNDAVFLFAQAPQGPPVPLAVQRTTAGQLPYRFTLDDSMAMNGADKLSNHAEVVITARLSKSGQAMPQSGDLQGRVGPVKLGRQDVGVAIDSVIP